MKISQNLSDILTGEHLNGFLENNKNCLIVLNKLNINLLDPPILLKDIYNKLSDVKSFLTDDECNDLLCLVNYIKNEHKKYEKEVNSLFIKLYSYDKESIVEQIINKLSKQNRVNLPKHICEKKIIEMLMSIKNADLYFLNNDEALILKNINEIKEFRNIIGTEDGCLNKSIIDNLRYGFNILRTSKELMVFYPTIFKQRNLLCLENGLIEKFLMEHNKNIKETGFYNKTSRLDNIKEIFSLGNFSYHTSESEKANINRLLNEMDIKKENLFTFKKKSRNEYEIVVLKNNVFQVANGIELAAVDVFLDRFVRKIKEHNNMIGLIDSVEYNEGILSLKCNKSLNEEKCENAINICSALLETLANGLKKREFNQIYLESAFDKHMHNIQSINPMLENKMIDCLVETINSKNSLIKENILKKEVIDVIVSLHEIQSKNNRLHTKC